MRSSRESPEFARALTKLIELMRTLNGRSMSKNDTSAWNRIDPTVMLSMSSFVSTFSSIQSAKLSKPWRIRSRPFSDGNRQHAVVRLRMVQ